MHSEHDGDHHRDSFHQFSPEVSREWVESLWRQALVRGGSGRTDLATAKANRNRAEMERQRTSAAALEATREACGELIAEAEHQLTRARHAEAEAERTRAEAETELKQAQLERSEADNYREKIIAESREKAQRIRDGARAAAFQESEDLKRRVSYEVQCVLTEIDTKRAAAQEELEAQRIYTEAATIGALSHHVRAQIIARVDGALNERTAANGEPTPLQEPARWGDLDVGERYSPERIIEPVQGTAESETRGGVDEGRNHDNYGVRRKSSKRGKGSSDATS